MSRAPRLTRRAPKASGRTRRRTRRSPCESSARSASADPVESSMSSGTRTKTVSLPGTTSTSKVFAVLATSESGRYVRAVVPASGSFKIYLNTSLTSVGSRVLVRARLRAGRCRTLFRTDGGPAALGPSSKDRATRLRSGCPGPSVGPARRGPCPRVRSNDSARRPGGEPRTQREVRPRRPDEGPPAVVSGIVRPPSVEARMGFEQLTVAVPGGEIFATRRGSGPAAIFLHGGPGVGAETPHRARRGARRARQRRPAAAARALPVDARRAA